MEKLRQLRTGYIAYLDLLGVSFKIDPEQYCTVIEQFVSEIIRFAQIIGPKIYLYQFSDCAFVEAQQLKPLIKFLGMFRAACISNGIYMKGAICMGNLDISGTDCGINLPTEQQKRINQLYSETNNVKGIIFLNNQIATLVLMEQQLKAAAFKVCEKIINQKYKSSLFVQSIARERDSDIPYSFFDVTYSYNEQSDVSTIVDRLLKDFTKSIIINKRYNGYYLSALISCINSVCFKHANLSVDFETSNFDSDNFNIIKSVLKIKNQYVYLYNNAKDLDWLYIALFNKISLDKEWYKDSEINVNIEFCKKIFCDNIHMNQYRKNGISEIPEALLDRRNIDVVSYILSLLSEF